MKGSDVLSAQVVVKSTAKQEEHEVFTLSTLCLLYCSYFITGLMSIKGV